MTLDAQGGCGKDRMVPNMHGRKAKTARSVVAETTKAVRTDGPYRESRQCDASHPFVGLDREMAAARKSLRKKGLR